MKQKKEDMMLSVSVTRDQYEYLQEIGHQAKASGGKKLNQGLIIRSLIKMAKEMKYKPGEGVKNEEQLLNSLIEALKKNDK